MYSRCYFLMIGRHREAPRTCPPMLRRCIGDASSTSLTSGDIASAAKKFNACIEILAMHSRCFVWKNDRRCIAECSGMHPRTLPNILSFPKHRRCIAEVSAMLRDSIPEYSLNISGASVFCGRARYTPVLIHAFRKRVIFYYADVFPLVQAS